MYSFSRGWCTPLDVACLQIVIAGRRRAPPSSTSLRLSVLPSLPVCNGQTLSAVSKCYANEICLRNIKTIYLDCLAITLAVLQRQRLSLNLRGPAACQSVIRRQRVLDCWRLLLLVLPAYRPVLQRLVVVWWCGPFAFHCSEQVQSAA